jgi:hypothetical protein
MAPSITAKNASGVPVDPGIATESIYAGGNLPQIADAKAMGIGKVGDPLPTSFAWVKLWNFAKSPLRV